MATSIPASEIVQVTPNVLGAGGNALDLNGLFLTGSTRAPIGTVITLTSYQAVAAYFGSSSTEAAAAAVYFLGFTNSNQKPGAMLFAQFNPAPVAAYLRGASLAGVTLAQLQAITGTLSVVVDGATKSASAINLSGVASFSAAAISIGAALATTVTYDSITGAFQITSPTTGANSNIGFASGTIAASLGLTQNTGAVTSQGATTAVPAPFMSALAGITGNWATFTTLTEMSSSNKLAFAAWTNSTDNNFLYVCWDTDVSPTTGAAPTSVGAQIDASQYSGIAMIYQDFNVAAFLMGSIASLDFGERNGRATMAFRNQTGLTPTITSAVAAQNLVSNGYNFYGAWATAADRFLFLWNGQVSGPFLWIDSYVNEIWMTNGFQQALMTLLTQAKSIPYNQDGYTLIRAACLDVINAAVNFGAIRPGVSLSELQAAQVDSAAGIRISPTLSTRGWYLQVKDPTAQVRAARGTPQCKFWYMDGQSVQSINLATVQVQ